MLGGREVIGALILAGALVSAPDPTSYVAPDGRAFQQLVADHVLPDPETTPGAAYTDDPALTPVTLAQVCKPGWTGTVRPPTGFTDKLRAEMTPAGFKPLDGELDHLLSIEDLGYPGSAANVDLSRKNLWWMIYRDRYGARVKDVLETKVHRLLCAGKITAQQAHDALIPNWLVGYVQYVGPLPSTETTK